MKVKNIMFSGFMAAILMGATGAADAAINVASKDYVDAKSGAVSQALETYKTTNDEAVLKNKNDIGTLSAAVQSNGNTLTSLSGTLATKAGKDYVDTELAKKVDLTVYNEKMTALGNTDTSLQSQIDAVKALTGETGVADQIASAVSAEKDAREAADAQIRTDFAGADATTLQSAKSYAESEADAAEAAAKTYADDLAVNYDTAGSAATAKSEAIAAAATDATNKANQALTDAKAYTDELANGAVKANTEAIAAMDSNYVSEDEMNLFKTSNSSEIAAAKKAGDDAQADLNSYKTTNNEALAGVRTTAEQGVADAATAKSAADAAQDAADAAAEAAAQALTDAKTYAEGQASAAQAAAEATAAADATSKANAAQAAAEQTAATALASAKSEIETELAKKISAPAACETQDCVLSINKATNTISWVPLTEPVNDYLN